MYSTSRLASLSISPFRRVLLPTAVLLWLAFLFTRAQTRWDFLPSLYRGVTPVIPQRPHYAVDVRKALTDDHLYTEGLPFSTPMSSPWRTTNVTLMHLGNHLSTIAFDKRRLADGQNTERDPFNPALLRLPPGLAWDFAIVARGPLRRHSTRPKIKGKVPIEQGLVAFGANMSSTFELFQVSDAMYLDFPSTPSLACEGWAHTFGAEDPRIWWSDDNLPMLSYTQIASDPTLCRTIAFVRDLRAAWPALGEVLSTSTLVPPILPAGVQDVSVELIKQRPRSVEKNWLAFYPGALPNPMQKPLFQYNLMPLVALEQNRTQPKHHQIAYAPISPAPSKRSEVCMPYWHKLPVRAVHQSVPLQRLTLCPRGTCIPDMTNTVYISFGQVKKSRLKGGGLEYGRFVVTWNVTSPYEYVSVGPEFRFEGTNDEDIVYALSMVFLPSEEVAPLHPAVPALNLGHAFLDDNAMVGLGLGDRHMATIVIPVKDLLSGGRLCEDAL